jgi:hypothetical protein
VFRGLDWLVEINVALWGYFVPMLGVFDLVRFKKGGPYGSEGTYISNKTAFVLLIGTALLSHFFLSPMVRVLVESLCSSNPIIGYVLIIIDFSVMWGFISKSRKRES